MIRMSIDLVTATLATIELDFRSGTKMVGIYEDGGEKKK